MTERHLYPLLCEEANFHVVQGLVKKSCDDYSHKHDIDVVRDVTKLNECLLKADESLDFYGSKFKKTDASFYKEAAHICYWINKLKPLRIESPKHIAQRLSGLVDWIPATLVGRVSKLEADQAKKFRFPINENVAFDIALTIIQTSQLYSVKTLSEETQNDVRNQIKNKNASHEKLKSMIVASLRYHNYSARALATMLEMSYRTTHV